MKKSVLKFGLALAAVVAMSSAANAATVWTSVAFDQGPAVGQSLVTDFENPAHTSAGYLFSYSGPLGLYTGTSSVAAKPALDDTQYWAVLSGNTAILHSDNVLSSLSIYIGSLDTYNSITFSGAGYSETFSGAQLKLPANGDQGAGSTNRTFYFTFDGADNVTDIAFNSTGNSFEFDNIFASAAVPEPRTWIMLILGFGLAGLMLRRRPVASQLAV